MTISDTVSIHRHAAIGEVAIERWRTRWTVQYKQTHIATARCTLINRDNFQESEKNRNKHTFKARRSDAVAFSLAKNQKRRKTTIIFDLLFISRFIWTLNVRQLIGRRQSYSCLFIKRLPYNVNEKNFAHTWFQTGCTQFYCGFGCFHEQSCNRNAFCWFVGY